jgi:hypothetical protein
MLVNLRTSIGTIKKLKDQGIEWEEVIAIYLVSEGLFFF